MDLEQRMRRDLVAAMKENDAVAVGALRTMLGVIGNAEAVPLADHDRGPVVGPTRDVPRRELTDADRQRVVREEIRELEEAAAESRAVDQDEYAARLESQIEVLARYRSDS